MLQNPRPQIRHVHGIHPLVSHPSDIQGIEGGLGQHIQQRILISSAEGDHPHADNRNVSHGSLPIVPQIFSLMVFSSATSKFSCAYLSNASGTGRDPATRRDLDAKYKSRVNL